MCLSVLLALLIVIFPLVLYYVLPWLKNTNIRTIPGPTIAAFSNLWLLYQCRQGRRFVAVDEAHKKYGTLVRIQPNHVSVADDQAINLIYGHGNGFLKRFVASATREMITDGSALSVIIFLSTYLVSCLVILVVC